LNHKQEKLNQKFSLLLKKYREALILFYVSLKRRNYESAFSFLPYVEQLQRKIIRILNNPNLILDKDREKLLRKILFIQNRIVIFYHNHKFCILSDLQAKYDNFHTKIDFLIKKFLQEKGL
jgi:hypothetical protein